MEPSLTDKRPISVEVGRLHALNHFNFSASLSEQQVAMIVFQSSTFLIRNAAAVAVR